jgi:predicted Zn-dependent peptidase
MKDDDIFFERTSAGIPVAVETIPGCESSGYMVAVGTGSRDEDGSIMGISHLLEHVVFRETATRDSYRMAKEIEGAGGELNAFTAKEVTAFYGVTIKETKAVARDMVSDIVANPLINSKDVELEKKIVLQEISMVRNNPESYIHDLFGRTIWNGHELSQDEAGEIDIVEGLDDGDLRAYYEERYKVPNLAVFAAGNVDPEVTLAWAEEKFDPLSGGKAVSRKAPARPAAKYDLIERSDEHCYVAMGFPAYHAGHPDRAAVMLLSAILGSGTSSRLFQGVREEKALVYAVYNSIDQNCDAASMATFLSSTKENVVEAVETAASIYGELRDGGLEEGELQRSKNLIKGATVRSMESTERRLYSLTRNTMLTGRPDSFRDRLAAIDSVTEDDVMRVAADLISPDRLNLTVFGERTRELEGFTPDRLRL